MMGMNRNLGVVSLALLCGTLWVDSATGFVPPFLERRSLVPVSPCATQSTRQYRRISFFSAKNNDESDWEDDDDDDDEEEEDDDIDLSDQDWRAFRAKLVMAKGGDDDGSSTSSTAETTVTTEDDGDWDGIGSVFESTTKTSTVTDDGPTALTPLDPSQWAYDSGKVIEQGAVILGGVEQEYGFGLRQQYFHKAAILVLDHDESTFTKGIILNRPTDLTLEDDMNPGVKWRVWFGGDVQNLESNMPDIVCLHSLKNKQATKASIPVMKDIQWTTFENAKKLVKNGVAQPTDFWVFCGYAGWGPSQLMGELDRKSWYMVATDSQTLLQELARLGETADPRDAGLDTWDLLMRMIGRGETADEYSGDFDDNVLKEWARQNLLSTEAGGGAGVRQRAPEGAPEELLKKELVDTLMGRLAESARGKDVGEGSLVRASSAERSPFLLESQELHKSVCLIISDDETLTVGVILNRPAAKGLDMQITDNKSGKSKSVTLPLRFGGQFAVKGQDPLLWLHCNPKLRAAEVGNTMGSGKNNIYKCSSEQVTSAIGRGLATPDDFIVVSGVFVWAKGGGGISRGIQGEIRKGRFEVIPDEQVEGVWDTLLQQQVLTKISLVPTLALANEAWQKGSKEQDKPADTDNNTPISGLGEGFDEEDDTLVFKSDVKVSSLSDDALRSWIATFLLGAPGLAE